MATRSIQRQVLKELAYEDASAVAVERRMANGAQLADEAVMAIAHLSHKIGTLADGRPGLELQLRGLQEIVVMGSADLLYKYYRG